MSKTVDVRELNGNFDDYFLVDVRMGGEFADVHVDGAVNMPLDRLGSLVSELKDQAAGKKIALICLTGKRSGMAYESLADEDIDNCFVVEGGITAWQDADLAVIKGAGTISLERQVRIAAGALVLTGVVLGAFVHPGFLALSGFVGAGLIFAGVTDTCGMAMLLARMPWNRSD